MWKDFLLAKFVDAWLTKFWITEEKSPEFTTLPEAANKRFYSILALALNRRTLPTHLPNGVQYLERHQIYAQQYDPGLLNISIYSPVQGCMTLSTSATTIVPSTGLCNLKLYCSVRRVMHPSSLSDSTYTIHHTKKQFKLDSLWAFPHLTSLLSSFHIWADATINGDLTFRLTTFLAFLHSFLAKARIEHYWLTICSSQAKHDFDIPRWYTDRRFFDRGGECKVHWKPATTLVGPGTLFLSERGKA